VVSHQLAVDPELQVPAEGLPLGIGAYPDLDLVPLAALEAEVLAAGLVGEVADVIAFRRLPGSGGDVDIAGVDVEIGNADRGIRARASRRPHEEADPVGAATAVAAARITEQVEVLGVRVVEVEI